MRQLKLYDDEELQNLSKEELETHLDIINDIIYDYNHEILCIIEEKEQSDE